MLTNILLFFSNLPIYLVANGYSTSVQSYSFSNLLSLLTLSRLLPISSHLLAVITAHLKHSISLFLGFIIAFLLDNHSGSKTAEKLAESEKVLRVVEPRVPKDPISRSPLKLHPSNRNKCIEA